MDPAGTHPLPAKKSLWRALALWAFCAFMLINAFLALSDKGLLGLKPSRKSGGVLYQACDSALDELGKGPPGVVLLGSSLMMAPVWSSDCKRYEKVPDFYHHHRCLGLEQRLRSNGDSHAKVTSMALPGAMVSDDYLIVDKLLKGDKKPDLIIYGLAPRDFMDDLLTGETRTVVFQELTQLTDLPSLGALYLPSWQEKADFTLNNAFFIYGKRWRYQDKLAGMCRKLTDKLHVDACETAAASVPAAPHAVPAKQALLAKKTLPSKEALPSPMDKKAMWNISVQEYQARYKHFNESQFEKQNQFLRLLLSVAQQRHIPVVLVNMPLTRQNLELMSPNLYQRYRQCLASAANEFKCRLVDMQADSDFNLDDFYDTVHLNASGGNKFIDKLAGIVEDCDHRLLAQRKQ